jgi:hypothetical protein
MKKITILFLMAAALALLVTPTQAGTVVNESTPLDLSVFVPCANGGAGELVELTGNLHILETLTVNGNNFSLVEHFQPQGVSGTGQTTGARYQATGVTSMSQKGSFQNGQATATFINRFDIIGQGPGNNFTIHETEHLTINADGTVTVFFDNFVADCK